MYTDGEMVLQLLEQLGARPEKEIFLDSPVDDFFNVIQRRADGTRVGVLSVFHEGIEKIFFTVLRDGMSHHDLFICLTIGLLSALAFGSKYRLIASSRKRYSRYEKEIEILQYKLKYTERRLRRSKRALRNAEGRLQRSHQVQRLYGDWTVSDIDKRNLEKEADFRKEAFCDTYKLEQDLVGALQDAIHADAEGKEVLDNFTSATKH